MTQATEHLEAARYLEQAVELAVRNVAEGGGPFGALVVTADGRVHEGVNRVTRDNDPTAHAEVVAIRAAAAGFDDALFYDYFSGTRPELMPVTRDDIPTSAAPFKAWDAFEGKREY